MCVSVFFGAFGCSGSVLAVLGCFWLLLFALGALLGRSWSLLGRSWVAVGAVLGGLGAVLCGLGAIWSGLRNVQLEVSEKLPQGEVACGSQAFIATLLFDPSMSALPIIVKQNSPRIGLFTR